MTNSVVIGAGWHPQIFRAEASQLIGSCKFVHPHALECSEEQAQKLILRSSLISEVLSPGGVVPLENSIQSIATEFLSLNLEGRVAVKSSRSGNKIDGWSGREVAGEIGGLIVGAGYEIDLTNPDITLRVHLLAPSVPTTHPDDFSAPPVVAWGLTISEGDDWAQRTAPNRPFFKPISLDPKLARSMVNLAVPDDGHLLDPFCGTGGLIVEGILCGIESSGSDLAWPMVIGSRENAAWAQELGGMGNFDIRNGSAIEIDKCWNRDFDGFVFDPPYGRNAWKSSDGFELFHGALKSCAKNATKQANLVTLIPWPPELISESLESGISFGKPWHEIQAAFVESGWVIKSTHSIRVHRSLARLLIHAERK